MASASAPDPRAKKKPRSASFSFEEMHRFAKAAGRYEAMVRVFTDTGMRLGEFLPLRREDFDGATLKVRRTAHEGTILEGTKTDHGEQDAGRVVPVPPRSPGCSKPKSRPTTPTAISSSRAPPVACGASATSTGTSGSRPSMPPALTSAPHECRHSYVTHLRAAGINDADLAEIAGHRVETMLARYTHAVGSSFDSIRTEIG